MTDRDTFAAAALTGLLATGQGPYHGEDYFAKAAYKAADAMLAEREKASGSSPPQVVRLPKAPNDFEISEANGYAVAMRDICAALTAAGVKWEVAE